MTFATALRTSELLLAFAFAQQALEHLAGPPRDRGWFLAQLLFAVSMAAAPWNGIAHLALLGVSVAAADVAAVAAPVSDAAVAALGQLSGLYQEQQYALMAA